MFVCLSEQAGLKVSQALPEKVKIVEVGPRDGLQNEKVTLFMNIYNTANTSKRQPHQTLQYIINITLL